MTPTNTYEAWVVGLRRWAIDPAVDLGDLPPLAVDSFTPETYRRFLSHLHTAIAGLMEAWRAQLTRDLGASHDEHDLARALVGLRLLLARRLELAHHPSFPPEISTALWDASVRDVQEIQRQLEVEIVRPRDGAARASSTQERQLQLVRKHSFGVLIQPNFPLQDFIRNRGVLADAESLQGAQHRRVAPGQPAEFTAQAPRRRVLLD